jgi:uncharacterized protein
MKRFTRSGIVPVLILLGVGASASAAGDNRLIDAVKSQDAVAVRALLKQKVEINVPQPDGGTALHWAAYSNDLEIVEQLIAAGAKVNAANIYGVTALSLACTNRNAAMVEKLVAAGADVNAATSTGETVLMTCARTGSPLAVKALLSHRANANVKEKLDGQTALMWAAAEGHADVLRVLIEGGADIQARSNVTRHFICFEAQCGHENKNEYRELGAFTPLLFAARNGDLESVRVLLAAGAKIEETAADGYTALLVASHRRYTQLGEFLLEQGANPNASGPGYSALHTAVLRSDVELVKALLAHGAQPNVRITKATPQNRFDYGWILPLSVVHYTPLLLAARYVEVEIMRALLAAGADPALAADDGTTVLMLAAGIGGKKDRRDRTVDPAEVNAQFEDEGPALEAVKLVLAVGSDVNATNKAGNTALHGAASVGFKNVLQYLVKEGGKSDAKNKAGATPSALLKKSGQDEP